MEPLISVIIPVYNVEKYLNRCVESVINQTYKNLEIILVDDGSLDKSAEMCDNWTQKDERIKVIHQKNMGLGAARNRGISVFQGEYIGFVDSDDWIANDMYSNLINLCKEYNADIACGGIKYVNNIKDIKNEKNEKIRCYSKAEYADIYFKQKENRTIHYAVNKLYKRKVAKNIVFPTGVINEDVEGFLHALLAANRIVETDKTVYYYWQNENGISYRWFSEKQLDLLTVWKNVCKICEEQKKDWVKMAELNYHRAYFGLLSRLMLNSKEEDNKYSSTEKKLLSNLKLYEKELLKSNMPLNRKIILWGMCRNYSVTKKIFRTFIKYNHRS